MISKKVKNIFENSTKRATLVLLLFFVFLTMVPQGTLKAETNDELRAKIDSLAKTGKVVKGQVNELGDQLSVLQQQIDETDVKIAELTKEIEDNKAQIKKATEDLKIKQETLNEYIRVIYEEGDVSTLELIVSSNNFSDFVDKAEYLQIMQLKINDIVERIQKLRTGLEKRKDDLDTKNVKLDGLRKQQAAQKVGLEQQKNKKQGYLGNLTSQEKKLRNKLAARMSAGYSYCRGGGTVIKAKNPIFSFPLNCGYISQGFGMTSFASCDPGGDCAYKGTIHNGIDVAQVGSGTAIMAIGDGTVYSTGVTPSGGWGNWVVIKHNNGYYSLYAHMISPSYLHSGDNVHTGDVVGGVGGTPYWPTHLHFSLYTNDPGSGPSYPGATVDPLDYMDIPVSTGGTDWDRAYSH